MMNIRDNQLHSFDPTTNQWSRHETTGTIPSPNQIKYRTCSVAQMYHIVRLHHDVWLFSVLPGEGLDCSDQGSYSCACTSNLHLFKLDLQTFKWRRYYWSNQCKRNEKRVYIPGVSVSFNFAVSAMNDHTLVLYDWGKNTRWFLDTKTLVWIEDEHNCERRGLKKLTSVLKTKEGVLIFNGDTALQQQTQGVEWIRLQPQSLAQIAMKAVLKCRATRKEWESLPYLMPSHLKALEDQAQAFASKGKRQRHN